MYFALTVIDASIIGCVKDNGDCSVLGTYEAVNFVYRDRNPLSPQFMPLYPNGRGSELRPRTVRVRISLGAPNIMYLCPRG